MAVGGYSRVLRPTTVEGLRAAFAEARAAGAVLGPRGTGCSYGDASVNEAGWVLDVTRMNRILSFDPATGVADCEAGVTIEQLWKHILPYGYWPKVESGTMYPTLAGAAAMNIHGKNNFAVGTIGDAIVDFDIVLTSGELRTCSRERNAELFHAAIGGFGMLGAFSRIRIGTKKVYSGDLEVKAVATRNLREMMEYFEDKKATSDYLVGWIDCFAGGDMLCRGLIHDARYLEPGEDPHPEQTLRLGHQELPPRIMGLLPKSEVWRFLMPFVNDLGMRAINASKYLSGRMEAMSEPHRQAHAAFAFLLDYVPNWKWSYGRGDAGRRGLIQYQPFLPPETAHETYTSLIRLCQQRGLVPYLGVFKRHRPDPFWLTHSTGGWSFAMDFRVTRSNRERLWKHCAEMTEIVLAAGGRFYFAKDLVIGTEDARRMFPPDKLAAFLELKRALDPESMLQTNLWRRCFGGA
jgi:FAD/FMN-containing dehydrogenase